MRLFIFVDGISRRVACGATVDLDMKTLSSVSRFDVVLS